MSERRTFVDLCLSGDATLDDIDDFVEAWHNSDSELELNDYLGMSTEEYGAWVESPHSLRTIIAARDQQISFREAAQRSAWSMAARAQINQREFAALEIWLKKHGHVP